MSVATTTLSKIWIAVIDLVIMVLSWYWFGWKMTVLVLLVRYADNIALLISARKNSARLSSDTDDNGLK